MLSFLLLVHLLDESLRWDAACAGGGNIQPSAFGSPQHSSLSPAGLHQQLHSTKGSWEASPDVKAGLAHLLLWAGQFTTDSILLQEFFFYVQNYCKTILCWISIWTYFIGLVKLLGRSWFPELFPLPTPGTTPQGEVALGMGQSEHQNITCPQSHLTEHRANPARATAKETAIASGKGKIRLKCIY